METIPATDPMENPQHSLLGGLNPADLLRQGVAGDTLAEGVSFSFEPPALDELAASFPQFEILQFIGQGGMGAVYKVRQKDLDRVVALKILPPSISRSPAFSCRFAREAKALAKLNHPGIVTIHEFGQADGLYFILMEFVDGVNLAQLMKSRRISPREALAIVPQICDALQFAHDHGIVHRDIKPENLLLNCLGQIKVADFGIAKLVGAEDFADDTHTSTTLFTEAGKILGTPEYMAPEQINHPEEVDHRADIYALGVVFYQMLTGELPGKRFEAPSKKIHIDVRLDEIVLQAMEKNPELRFQQASVMKTRLETMDFPSEITPPNRNPFLTLGEVRGGRFVLAWPKIFICYALIAGMMLLGATAVMAMRGIPVSVSSRNLIMSLGIAAGTIGCMVLYARSAALGTLRWKAFLATFGLLIFPGIAIPFALDGTRDKVMSSLDVKRDDKPRASISNPSAGPVEVWLLERGGPVGGVDLDLAKFVSYPRSADHLHGAVIWREEQGVDLILDMDSASPGVLITGTQVKEVDAAWWDETPEAAAAERVLPPREDHPLFDERMTFLSPAGTYSRTKTWIYRTVAGSVAILRLSRTHSESGVQVMGRLISTGHPEVKSGSGKPSTAVPDLTPVVTPPELRRLDWQDQVKACAGDAWLPSGEVDASNDWFPPINATVDISETPAAKEKPRFLCLWISHPQFDDMSLVELKLLDADGKEPLITPPGNFALHPDTGWITATLCAGKKGSIPLRATVSLRYAAGKWQFWNDIAPDFSGTIALGNGVMMNGPGQGADGHAFIQLTRDRSVDPEVEQFDFVAIIKDGRHLERTGHATSSSGKVTTERFQFDAPLAQIRSFECRKRSIHGITWPVVLQESSGNTSKMKIDFDCAGDSLQNILANFRRKYDVRIAFENLDFDAEKDAVTLGRRIATLEEKQRGGKLTAAEGESLKDAWRLRRENKLGDETLIDVDAKFEGVIHADSVEDFLNQLTKDTPYDCTMTDDRGTWVILPREGSRLNYPVNLDTTDLTVEEAVKQVIAMRPAGSEIGIGQLITRPFAPGTDSDPWLHVKCQPAKFQGIPAWQALSMIGEGAMPDSVWELAGYKEHRMLALAPGTSIEHAVISEAQAWLLMVDRGESSKSHGLASDFFQKAIASDQWDVELEKFRKPLGEIMTRKLLSAQSAKSLPGAPDGKYLVMQFESTFAAKEKAVETVTYRLENDGSWKAAGCFIR